MSRRVRKLKDEMLITHRPANPKGLAAGNAPVASGGEKTLASLQSELVSAATAADRRAILRSIQEQFGNDAAQEAVRDARIPPPADENGGKS